MPDKFYDEDGNEIQVKGRNAPPPGMPTKAQLDEGAMTGPTTERIKAALRPTNIADSLPSVLGTVGGIAAAPETLGIGAIPGAAGGAAIGSVVKNLLKMKYPQIFGEGVQDPAEAGVDLGKDVLLQGVLPEAGAKALTAPKVIAGKLLGNKVMNAVSPGVRQGIDYTERVNTKGLIADMAKQRENSTMQDFLKLGGQAEDTAKLAGNYTGEPIKIIENGAQNVQDKNPIQASLSGGSNPTEDQLRIIKNTPPGGPQEVQLNKLHKSIVSDPANFRNYIAATGDTEGAKQLALHDVISSGFGKGTNTLNPGKILDSLAADKNNIYKEGIDDTTRKNLTDFLTQAKNIQADAATAEQRFTQAQKESGAAATDLEKTKAKTPNNNLLSWRNGRLQLAVLGSVVGGPAAHAVSGGLILTDAALAKLMRDPEIAQLATQSLKTGLKSPEAKPLQQVLTHALAGLTAQFDPGNGDKPHLVTFDADGNPQSR